MTLPLVAYRLAKSAVSSIAVAVEVEVNASTFSITWKVGGLWSHTVEGRTEDISSVDVLTLQVSTVAGAQIFKQSLK